MTKLTSKAAARLHGLTVISTAIYDGLKAISVGINSFGDAPKHSPLSPALATLQRAASFCGFWGVANYLGALHELAAGIEAIPPSSVERAEYIDRIKTLAAGINALCMYLRDLSAGNVVSYSVLNEQFGFVIRKARPQLLEVNPELAAPYMFMPAPPSLEVEAQWVAASGASVESLVCSMETALSSDDVSPSTLQLLSAFNPFRTLSGLFDAAACPAAHEFVSSAKVEFLEDLRRLHKLLTSDGFVEPPAPDAFLFSRILFSIVNSSMDDELSLEMRRRYSLMKPGAGLTSMQDVAKKFADGMRRFQESFTQASLSRTPTVVSKLTASVLTDSHRLDSPAFSAFILLLSKTTATWGSSATTADEWVFGSALILLLRESAETVGNSVVQAELLELAKSMETSSKIQPCTSLQASVRTAAVQKACTALAENFKVMNRSIEGALRTVGSKLIDAAQAARIRDVVGAPLGSYLKTVSGVTMCFDLPCAADFARRVSEASIFAGSWADNESRRNLFDDLLRVNLFISRLRPGSLLDMDPDEERELTLAKSGQVISLFGNLSASLGMAGHTGAVVPAAAVTAVFENMALAATETNHETNHESDHATDHETGHEANHSEITPLTSFNGGSSEFNEFTAKCSDIITECSDITAFASESGAEEAPRPEPSPDVNYGIAAELLAEATAEAAAAVIAEAFFDSDVGGDGDGGGDGGGDGDGDGFDLLTGLNVPAAELPSTDALRVEFLDANEGRSNSLDGSDEELLAVMFEESWQCLDSIDAAFAAIRAGDESKDHVGDSRRFIHTLKGVCRTCGLNASGAILHSMEDRLDAMPGNGSVMLPVISAFEHAMAVVREQLETERAAHQISLVPAVTLATERLQITTLAPEVETQTLVAVTLVTPVVEASRISNPLAQRPSAAATVRIPVQLATKVGTASSQILIASRQSLEDVSALNRLANELDENLRRMSPALRELEIMAASSISSARVLAGAQGFDPLELDRYTQLQEVARRLTEAFGDTVSSASSLSAGLRRAVSAEDDRVLLTDDLQRGTSELLLVPLISQQYRLDRVVAKACADAARQATLVISPGARVPAAALDKLMPVFEHLLRNAVAHGIEPAGDRVNSSKNVRGSITIEASSDEARDSGVVRLAVRDDGAGIDLRRVFDTAVSKGLVSASSDLSDDGIRELLFSHGFSTASAVNELAGRGVGLDVVRTALSSLGGMVSVSSVAGHGTEFLLTIPTDASSMAVIPVTAAGFKCLLPLTLVRRIVPVSAGSEVVLDASSGRVVIAGDDYELIDLSRRVPGTKSGARSGRGHLVLMRDSNVVKAVLVDSVGIQTRVVVRPLGPFVRDIPGMVAGTALPSGGVGLVVNPLHLGEINVVLTDFSLAKVIEARQAIALKKVMVVDDSSTVRLVTSRFLKRSGFVVDVARDGLEAMQMLTKGLVPDIFLFDLEMPGMGGFELIVEVRRIPAFARTPIVIITSRWADKHREHAMSLGATAYLAKPYEESQLLEAVIRLTNFAREASSFRAGGRAGGG